MADGSVILRRERTTPPRPRGGREWFEEPLDLTMNSVNLPDRAERRAMRRLGERFALTRRAIWLGLGLVAFIAAFTPYNDYVLQNTPFIGNHFPIGIVSLLVVLILLVNPALMLFRRKPLTTGELVVIMTMMMIGAAAPSSGLMRYLEPMVVAPFWLVKDFPWLKPIANLMPSWLVPTWRGHIPSGGWSGRRRSVRCACYSTSVNGSSVESHRLVQGSIFSSI